MAWGKQEGSWNEREELQTLAKDVDELTFIKQLQDKQSGPRSKQQFISEGDKTLNFVVGLCDYLFTIKLTTQSQWNSCHWVPVIQNSGFPKYVLSQGLVD